MVNQTKKIERNSFSDGSLLVKPISENRIIDCIVSAEFWASSLPLHSGDMRKRADYFAIASSFLSAITALGIWSTFAASTSWPAVLGVSLVAIASAIVAQVPKIKGYAKCAEDSARLSSRYGNVLGELKDSLEMLRNGHQEGPYYAFKAINTFEGIKREKDALQPYPVSHQEKVIAIRAGKMQ